ncbi:hypothetical protein BFP72_05995 [Reichenbachiella sp. 5M10]|uniref:hypothetical protein n=1 Tax=Reichenbachiella sp. 5M10 TaxID=1889772 RepID=UPI000C15FBD1|nr:hypothetical protein [Reichenbachiella sp. 5M10]PIB34974.1 hypothetical protein BFP72_05995 [Reichenbachiella sp. 5M10]
METDNMDSFLNSTGFGFPESSEDIESFNQFSEGYEFKADVNKIDPSEILNSVRKQSQTISGVDYHKRTVLAAEIVFQLHSEWSLGHLKLQKLIYLCQQTTGMAIHTNFLRQAMGPYDPRLMRSIDSQFVKNKWFKYNKSANQKYIALENAGDHKEWFERYFRNEIDDINLIIDLFRKMKTRQVELIGTVYACWVKVLEEKNQFDEKEVISKFYNWSEEKEKFNIEEIKNAISWMLEYKIYPIE